MNIKFVISVIFSDFYMNRYMIVRVSSVLRAQEDNDIDNDIGVPLKNTIPPIFAFTSLMKSDSNALSGQA